MEDAIYTLVIGGKPQGPFTLEELKTKKVKPDSFLRTPGMDDYKEAHEFPELREFLGFKQQYTSPQYFAGFDLRMLAMVIDWFLVVGAIICIELFVVLSFEWKDFIFFLATVNAVIIPIIKFIYQVYLESTQQATFGKKWLNIRVTNLDGLRPTFIQVFFRNLSKLFSTVILFFGYFYLFLNKKQQCLHDVMANTLVIKDRLV